MSLGIAILGAGLFPTQAHLPALSHLTNSVSLIAIYSRSLESASTLANLAQKSLSLPSPPAVYHDQGGPHANLQALLSRTDVHAVIVALPITVQPDIIKAALTHGKHVLSEKPVAPDVAQGLDLIHWYESQYKHKLVWRVAENYEAEPAYRKVAELVNTGKIGKPVYWRLAAVNSHRKDNKWYQTPWRTIPEYQGGFLLDGGVHSAALLRIALPSHPSTLSAHVSLAQEHLQPADTLTALILSSDGSHGLFELCMGAPVVSRSDSAFKVTGVDGWIDLSRKDGKHQVLLQARPHKDAKEGEEIKDIFTFDSVSIQREIECFVDAVHGGPGDHIGDPREALRDVAFIEASLKSKGETIDLDKLVKEGKV